MGPPHVALFYSCCSFGGVRFISFRILLVLEGFKVSIRVFAFIWCVLLTTFSVRRRKAVWELGPSSALALGSTESLLVRADMLFGVAVWGLHYCGLVHPFNVELIPR